MNAAYPIHSVRLCVDRFPFPVPSPGEETNGRKQIQIIVKFSVTRCTRGHRGRCWNKDSGSPISVHPPFFFVARFFRYCKSRVFFLGGGGRGKRVAVGIREFEKKQQKMVRKIRKPKPSPSSFSNISRTLSAYMNVVLRSSYFMWFGYVWLKCVFV